MNRLRRNTARIFRLFPALALWLFMAGRGAAESAGQMRPPGDDERASVVNYGWIPSGSIVFFPPVSPAFGEPVTAQFFLNSFNGQIVPAPERLADYVAEYFYPALGTRIVSRSVDRQLDARLEAYRATRTRLVNELLEQIELSSNRDRETREHALQAFARTQAPALAALEADAEALRIELIEGGFFSGTDWNANRAWSLGVTPFPSGEFATNAEYQVMRAAAHYQKGLSIQQRGLLREIAMELAEKVRPGPHLPTDATTAMFFSPETTRITLPPKLPPALVEKIGVFNREKTALKSELRDTVFAEDKTKSAAKRLPAFQSLAELQRSRFVALDNLAEEIRCGLAAVPGPPPPPAMPHIPPALNERIAAYNLEKLALNTEINQRLMSVRLAAERAQRAAAARAAEIEAARKEAISASSGPSGVSDADRAWIDRIYATPAADTRITADIRKEFAARLGTLQHHLESLRSDLAAYARTQVDPLTGKPLDPDTLTRAFNTAAERFDKMGREEAIYRNYKIATLEPGLSPEQRRLLFGAALVGLAQPLPSGEKIPGKG